MFSKKDYPDLEFDDVKRKLLQFLRKTFKQTFYTQNMLKFGTDTNKLFTLESDNDIMIDMIVSEIMRLALDKISDMYSNMKIAVNKIFDTHVSQHEIINILKQIEKKIDINKLFHSECMEIDIYCEQSLDEEDFDTHYYSDSVINTKNHNIKIPKDKHSINYTKSQFKSISIQV